MKIKSVIYLSNYLLEISFEDGKTVLADFEKFLRSSHNPMTNQFLNIERFKDVKVEHSHLTWEDGEMDISAEGVYKGQFSPKVTPK